MIGSPGHFDFISVSASSLRGIAKGLNLGNHKLDFFPLPQPLRAYDQSWLFPNSRARGCCLALCDRISKDPMARLQPPPSNSIHATIHRISVRSGMICSGSVQSPFLTDKGSIPPPTTGYIRKKSLLSPKLPIQKRSTV